MILRISDVRVRLAWLGVDDAAWVNVHLEDLFNLGFGGAIKASTQSCEKADDLRVRVALDRCVMLANAT